MLDAQANRPKRSFLLIDDDKFSARFFTRQLRKRAEGKASIVVKWLNTAKDGITALQSLSAKSANDGLPNLVVVDLKTSSSANLEFLRSVSLQLQGTTLRIAVFTASKDVQTKQALTDAGATAVFERHSNLENFGAELDSLLQLSAEMARAA